MRTHRWFAPSEIDLWPETIYPEDLSHMLRDLAEAP
jgi:hypothetical protein